MFGVLGTLHQGPVLVDVEAERWVAVARVDCEGFAKQVGAGEMFDTKGRIGSGWPVVMAGAACTKLL